MNKPHLLPFALILLCFTGHASESDEQAIQALIDNYGIDPLIEVIIEKRFGEVTVKKGNGFVDRFGKPRKDLVSAATILKDLEKSKMTVEQFSSTVQSKLETDNQLTERMQSQPETAPTTPSARSSNLTTEVRVRYGEGDPACRASCKEKYRVCQAKTIESSNKCSTLSKGVDKCLSKNQSDAIACNRKQLECEDTCYQ